MNVLEQRIRDFDGRNFEALALDVFQFQYNRIPVYKKYCDSLNRTQPQSLAEIPFLPIEFFKKESIFDSELPIETIFKSSGTGGERSLHHVHSLNLYEHTFERIYRQHLGNPEEQVILALLPNYLEQGSSSLVYMVDRLIEKTNNPISGFYLNDPKALVEGHHQALAKKKQAVIFGVSYALLDLAEQNVDLSEAIVLETGGMKGRRKELTKAELHAELCRGLNVKAIASEYGMTELLSQGYSLQDGLFQPGITMQILIREVNDPFSYTEAGKTGGINVIDLANLYSCSFIETQDLGKMHPSGFEIMGRFDHTEVRGCNLMLG